MVANGGDNGAVVKGDEVWVVDAEFEMEVEVNGGEGWRDDIDTVEAETGNADVRVRGQEEEEGGDGGGEEEEEEEEGDAAAACSGGGIDVLGWRRRGTGGGGREKDRDRGRWGARRRFKKQSTRGRWRDARWNLDILPFRKYIKKKNSKIENHATSALIIED